MKCFCGVITKWLILLVTSTCVARDMQIVDQWADTLGQEIFQMANNVAQPNVLKARYKEMNTKVVHKSGDELIEVIRESVGRMLHRKMDAVRCILKAAESASENYETPIEYKNITYVSGKFSEALDEEVLLPENLRNVTYSEMTLTPDSHFYNIPVNINYSSVQIPTNVYDLSHPVAEAISWSEELDETFRQNYRSDPALSWQYFGSTTGMLRQYPAMRWKTLNPKDRNQLGVDPYDCRIRSWYIEAATCSKDMVILVDNSGSMTGIGKSIARRTVWSLLETLSNNDFVAIMNFSDTTQDVVRCFKDRLVQATPENLKKYNELMLEMKPDGIANITEAFIKAFTLLKNYRETRGCGPQTPCNQLIMLVTDGIASNITEIFQAWNWADNSTNIPVRVFTYLLGKEVTKVREIQWMACLNRGYYVHIHNQEESREQVLKYINVVARPLVLQGVEHPVRWTHVYADVTNPALSTWLWLVMDHEDQKSRLQKHLKGKELGVRVNEDTIYIKQMEMGEDVRANPSDLNSTLYQEYRLLLSVSIPVFDLKGNKNNRTRKANLLGVAGTDVPLDEIGKLTLPFKLGVNGYVFIVSNNGYVILHPDLRPVSNGDLKLNYNSVDLTEVEILNDDSEPRQPGQEILKLRQMLVDHANGSMRNVSVKLHYDSNKRVTLEYRDYFFRSLPGTPFGIAVALSNYGTTWIKVGDEISRTLNKNINILDLFAGEYWRIYPGWIYCRYHYPEGHKERGEKELLHFIKYFQENTKRGEPWYMPSQYDTDEHDTELNCTRRTLDRESYYCNAELMQLLVFDARATYQSFVQEFPMNYLAKTYNVFLRFIATQSGLTRWQYIGDKKIGKGMYYDKIEFGDLHKKAVNEPWYKGAIFQHQVDPESVSITVPPKSTVNPIVTVSMGIFPKDGGLEAPAAVVGFQMPMKAFLARFKNITSRTTNENLNCALEWMHCYLIDQNGYVVTAEADFDPVGDFLGIVHGPIMQSLVLQGIFSPVEIYDYQAFCENIVKAGSGNSLINPLKYIIKFFSWILMRVVWYTVHLMNLPVSLAEEDDDSPEASLPQEPLSQEHEENQRYPCDEKRTLYIMDQAEAAKGVTNSSIQCSRPFYAQKVPHTNLLLLVVNVLPSTCELRLSIEPEIIEVDTFTNASDGRPCHKIPLNDLSRRRLESCFTEHPLEDEIEACGGTSKLQVSLLLLTIIICRILCKVVEK
ncbi:voltage-dependent calcium channel subunit alpha-2/delta-3 isoform X1 [Leptopilina heterotoma]|uniref:voltage-dependent calcium channel subunit alpha-2/delta-3 isoform X1 n=1 Tax=Leptopilina heterotoma TaxID=63436 RepID=UPI001CA814D3|nr:voltage-dependent calcium channel subunit alpha-2/delta-3 isoform X1 [Leptopilina heterotoma]